MINNIVSLLANQPYCKRSLAADRYLKSSIYFTGEKGKRVIIWGQNIQKSLIFSVKYIISKGIKMIPRREKTCFSFSDNLLYLIFIIGKYFLYDKKITIYNKKEKI